MSNSWLVRPTTWRVAASFRQRIGIRQLGGLPLPWLPQYAGFETIGMRRSTAIPNLEDPASQ